MRRVFVGASLAVALGAASSAAATPGVTFPPTEFTLAAGSQFELGAGDLESGSDKASAGFTPGGPFVEVSGGSSLGAEATATWNFEITTGDPFERRLVEVDIVGGYEASSSAGGFAVGEVLEGEHNANGGLTRLFLGQCLDGSAGLGTGGCGVTGFTLKTKVFTNDFNDIEILVNGGLLSGSNGNFLARVDPLISIDPDFAGQGLTLRVSPDAQPTSGAPEPAAWALMILGFGGVGVAMRRRQLASGAI